MTMKNAPKVVILDNNELSILKYAQEYPENWKRICEALDKGELPVKITESKQKVKD